METFKGMTFKNRNKPNPNKEHGCRGHKELSRVYMATVIKFVDPEPVLPILDLGK